MLTAFFTLFLNLALPCSLSAVIMRMLNTAKAVLITMPSTCATPMLFITSTASAGRTFKPSLHIAAHPRYSPTLSRTRPA